MSIIFFKNRWALSCNSKKQIDPGSRFVKLFFCASSRPPAPLVRGFFMEGVKMREPIIYKEWTMNDFIDKAVREYVVPFCILSVFIIPMLCQMVKGIDREIEIQDKIIEERAVFNNG